jgi:hypothetical protein
LQGVTNAVFNDRNFQRPLRLCATLMISGLGYGRQG